MTDFLGRSVAESNCFRRFCRPLPNPSANRPYCVLRCKDRRFLLTSKIIGQLFFQGDAGAADLSSERRVHFGNLDAGVLQLRESGIERAQYAFAHMLQQMGGLHHFTGNNLISGLVIQGIFYPVGFRRATAFVMQTSVYRKFITHHPLRLKATVVSKKLHSFDFYDSNHTSGF